MSEVVASAPGKVIVAGEYAVLDGAPAICMAVNRRTRVSIATSQQAQHIISAPGFLAAPLQLDSIDECANQVPLLAALWQQLSVTPGEYLDIELDSREFQYGDQKLGVGSSAAVAVALAAALNRVVATDSGVLDLAMNAHRDLQEGSGSGTDVACSYSGGVIEYRMPGSEHRSVAWPDGLHFRLLWSGRSADTKTQLRKLEQAQTAASKSALNAAAEGVADAWLSQRSSNVIAALSDYVYALRRFDADHDLGIFDAGHAELMDAAGDDVVYKPCGAGGGDLGIAVSTDVEALAVFVDSARQHNFEALDLAIDSTGVEVEGSIS